MTVEGFFKTVFVMFNLKIKIFFWFSIAHHLSQQCPKVLVDKLDKILNILYTIIYYLIHRKVSLLSVLTF